MAIHRERFDLALARLPSSDWVQFEQLASAFLASDYPKLRTMAAASGDGGRDSELFAEEENNKVVFQYSVTENWSKKIKDTVERLKVTFPQVDTVIYMTNRIIGASGDKLKKTLRDDGYYIDICDRSWFLDRANSDTNRQSAAEALAVRYVDPLVSSKTIARDLVPSLNGDDSKTALLFLEMQIQDSNKSSGLTKSSYDSLVLAALKDTNTTNRLNMVEIKTRVRAFLPTHPERQVNQRVEASIARLKDKIRFRNDDKKYHLNDAERQRLATSIAKLDKLRQGFEADVISELSRSVVLGSSDVKVFCSASRLIIETYFLRKGEAFAQAAIEEKPHRFDEPTIRDIVVSQAFRGFGLKGVNQTQVMVDVLTSVLDIPTTDTSAYLDMVLQSYTLFAFLAATPDVQRVTQSMFGGGELWLDTTVLLPLFAESAAPVDERPFTDLFAQCKAASLKLLVTDGVVEEIERHFNRCFSFVRSPAWDGDVPYLVVRYIRFGGKKSGFASWAERFLGNVDPVQDIADYLRTNHTIRTESAVSHPHVSQALADAVRDAWQSIHTGRRDKTGLNGNLALRLAAHDTENYLHVLSSRINQRGRAPLGYSDWWLTMDRSARHIVDRIDPNLWPAVNIGPVMSLDFLLRYLALGPSRDRVDASGFALAKVYADTLAEPVPPEFLALVDSIRIENAGLDEPIMQRRIRDRLNSERSRLGEIDEAGMEDASGLMSSAY